VSKSHNCAIWLAKSQRTARERLSIAAGTAANPWRRGPAYTCDMTPHESSPGPGGKHAALYVSLHHGENRPSLDGQVVGCLRALSNTATWSSRPASPAT